MEDLPSKHLFDTSILGDVYGREIINCGAGAPGPDLLAECSKNFRTATEHRMAHELRTESYLFQYGPTLGTTEFRQTLAGFLSKHYHETVDAQSLVVTSGASQGLHLILSTLISMNGIIFVDSVTYMIALEAMAQFNQMRIVPVPFSTTTGVDAVALEAIIEAHKESFKKNDEKLFWGLYYTIPTFHNPTGVLFSAELNAALIKLARKYDILIACDDVYNILNYVDPIPTKRLFAYDDKRDVDYQGNVISNGTFSKILAPGLRCGWMECAPRIVKAFFNNGTLKSGGCANNYTAGIIGTMIELGLFDEQLKLYHAKYRERMEVGLATLDAKLPKDCKVTRPMGGYFIWIEFPSDVNSKEFNVWCRDKYKVCGIPGPLFSAEGNALNCLRLTIAFHPKETIEFAFGAICEAYLEFRKQFLN